MATDLNQIDWAAYAANDPAIYRDFIAQQGRKQGIKSLADFGQWHYSTYGANENRDLSPYDPQAKAQKVTDASNAAAEQAKADALVKRQGAISNATTQAQTSADDIVRQWGLDPTTYDPRISSAIGNLTSSLGDTTDPYSALNGESIATKLLTGDQTLKRNQLTQQADSKFGANYGSNLIDSHLLDSTITDILGHQTGDAQSYLDRGLARGIYNDTGYNAGHSALESQASAGRSKLGTIADDVLTGYRTKANGIRDRAYGAAGSANLTSNINLDDYVKQGQDILNTAQTRGAGDVLSTLGGQNFFDFGGLTNAAGAAQGTTNLRDSGIASALADRENKKQAARGLGSQGVF